MASFQKPNAKRLGVLRYSQ